MLSYFLVAECAHIFPISQQFFQCVYKEPLPLLVGGWPGLPFSGWKQIQYSLASAPCFLASALSVCTSRLALSAGSWILNLLLRGELTWLWSTSHEIKTRVICRNFWLGWGSGTHLCPLTWVWVELDPPLFYFKLQNLTCFSLVFMSHIFFSFEWGHRKQAKTMSNMFLEFIVLLLSNTLTL